MTEVTFTVEIDHEGPEFLEAVAAVWRHIELAPVAVKVKSNSVQDKPLPALSYPPGVRGGISSGGCGTKEEGVLWNTANTDGSVATTLHAEKRRSQRDWPAAE